MERFHDFKVRKNYQSNKIKSLDYGTYMIQVTRKNKNDVKLLFLLFKLLFFVVLIMLQKYQQKQN